MTNPQSPLKSASSALSAVALSAFCFPLSAFSQPSFPVQVTVNPAQSLGPVTPIWNWFGYDEPNYTYLPHGSNLLASLAKMGGTPVYIRAHHMFTSGDGSPALKWGSTGIYREDEQGNPVYDFKIADRIVDTWVGLGLKPLMELGFMPEALSTKPEGYPKNLKTNDIIWAGGAFHYPPKDYKKWGDLCHAWTRHCVERYGRQEAASWRWQVWNEPNINYWKGTPEEFLKLYDYAADGIRRALPEAIIGGPHTADGNQNKWMPQFFEHVLRGTNFATGKVGSPLDFVAFHAKGKPSFTNNHVRMGIAKQLSIISNAFTLIGTYPELKDKPIIFGETDPDGCAACIKPDLGYRNTTLYSSYTAASFIRKLDLAARYGLRLEGAVTWAFEFEHSPLFSNQRQLTTGGIDLPVRHVFRLFDRLRGERISATSDGAATLDDMANKGVRDKPDVGVFASRDGDTVKVLLWHYHDDDVPGPDAAVTLRLTELPFHAKRTTLREFRIDTTHSNALEAWKKMGSPASPTPEQREQLKSAAALAAFPVREASVTEGALTTAVTVPRQAVVLLEFETPP